MCGSVLKFHDYKPLTVGATMMCHFRECINYGTELAVPQVGSPLYAEVMQEQADPNWKPRIGGGVKP